VVAPTHVAERHIHQFVQAKQQWIEQALAKIEAKQGQQSLAPAVYGHGVDIPYQGATYKLTVRASGVTAITIAFDQELIAYMPEALALKEHSAELKTAFTQWMKQQAQQQVERLVKQHGATRQLFPQAVRIKTQKSRWGSCGIRNDININWLLIIAPPDVLEYVVVHELCHIKIRNHSAHFWALVAEHLPDYQSRRRWLKQHGSRLMQGL
jgi:hypothetical protein